METFKATGKSPSAIDLHRELNLLKKISKEEGGIPWMYLSSKCAPQEALRNLDKAYDSFFRRCKKGDKVKGFPRFKSRKNGIGSFRLTGAIRAGDSRIQLPCIGSVRLKERGYLPTEKVRVLSASISEASGRWFVSLQVEEDVAEPTPLTEHFIGVDVGIKVLAMTSDGVSYENHKALSNILRLLRIRQKAVSRKKKVSANRAKAVQRVARLHRRIGNERKDSIHKATTAIIKQASVIAIESLNVAGMVKNRRLSRALSDASMGEFHRQLRYKAEWRGVKIVEADRFYPSSKRCSRCGDVKETLSLSERTFVCNKCGLVEDRDLNAALNLKHLAVSSTATACCPGSAGLRKQAKLLVGQESSRSRTASKPFATV